MSEAHDPFVPPRRTLPLIASISALFGVQWAMLLILVPLYVLHLGYSVAWVGVVLAAQGGFQFFLRFFGGVASDRFGERPVLRVGFVGMLIGSLIFAFSTSLFALISAQLFIGMSRAVYNPAGQSYASRISETDRARVIGRYRAGETLGQAAGPLLGGAVVVLSGFRLGFELIAVVNGVALAATFLLPDIPRRIARSLIEVIRPVPAMVRSRPMLLAGLFAFGVSLVPAAFVVLVIPALNESGVSAFQVGLLVSVFAISASAGSFTFGRISKRLRQPTIFMISMGTVAFVFVAIAATGGMPWMIPIMMLLGVAYAVGNTLRMVLTAQFSAPEQRGIAVAYVGSYWALAQFVGPIILGLIAAAAGLNETLILVAAFTLLYAAFSPVLYRSLAPKQSVTSPKNLAPRA